MNSLFYFYYIVIALFLFSCAHCFTPPLSKCDDSDSLKNITDYSFSSEIVSCEYIIGFYHYYLPPGRLNILNKLFSKFTIEWKRGARNDISFKRPSDFELVKIVNCSSFTTSEILSEISKNKLTKYASVQRRLTRTLARKVSGWFDEDYEDYDNISFSTQRKLLNVPHQITDLLQANVLWKHGFTGQGIKVAVLDTGLKANHPHFKNIVDRTDWTGENLLNDGIGHGTFVAGVIASGKHCLGLAPDADLYIFRVFTNKQISYTSWFLDAFNYALFKKIHVLNLSIGGSDFLDKPFVEKVWELSAKNSILVSAIGNHGPVYGTLNNPADQLDVIGVGGMDYFNKIAPFSSRGMTTWEIPYGYGRVKPDLVTYGYNVMGSKINGGCRTLSGTSFASPVVTGAIALLLSAAKEKLHMLNPASIKQILTDSAIKLENSSIFEQGHGRLNLIGAYEKLKRYQPHISTSPANLNFSNCPYMWPFCSQEIFYSSMPLIVNISINNGVGVVGSFGSIPKWKSKNSIADHLDVSFGQVAPILFPWSGYLAVFIAVYESGRAVRGIASGEISFEIKSRNDENEMEIWDEVRIPLEIRVIPQIKRSKRLLWDQFHNLRYPSGYFPRDDLDIKNQPLDWNGDHIHTNFKGLYNNLRQAGYFIDVLGHPFSCFDANFYGAVLLIDPEEEFFKKEIVKLQNDIEQLGLSLIVFADWYNTDMMQVVKFYDENTRRWWFPETGGSNIPALNDLLHYFGISFGDKVFSGSFQFNGDNIAYPSGTYITDFPESGRLYYADNLKDQTKEAIEGTRVFEKDVTILGLYQTPGITGGRIVAYGDSSCLDDVHILEKSGHCYDFFLKLIEYTTTGYLDKSLIEITRKIASPLKTKDNIPARSAKAKLHKYSKVIHSIHLSERLFQCPSLSTVENIPLLPSWPFNDYQSESQNSKLGPNTPPLPSNPVHGDNELDSSDAILDFAFYVYALLFVSLVAIFYVFLFRRKRAGRIFGSTRLWYV